MLDWGEREGKKKKDEGVEIQGEWARKRGDLQGYEPVVPSEVARGEIFHGRARDLPFGGEGGERQKLESLG